MERCMEPSVPYRAFKQLAQPAGCFLENKMPTIQPVMQLFAAVTLLFAFIV